MNPSVKSMHIWGTLVASNFRFFFYSFFLFFVFSWIGLFVDFYSSFYDTQTKHDDNEDGIVANLDFIKQEKSLELND